MARVRNETAEAETIKVSIAPLFAEVKTYTVPKGTVVSELLEKAGIGEDVEIRLDGNGEIFLDDELKDGQTISVVSNSKVQAGR